MGPKSETVKLQIEGMDCVACATTITKTIEKAGYANVNVDYVIGEATFENPAGSELRKVKHAIESLGYKVHDDGHAHEGQDHTHQIASVLQKKFWLCVVFTTPLILHMFIDWAPLHDPWVQLFLSIPVLFVGLLHFGKSAWGSVKVLSPNMDVLIFIGSFSAFAYSLAGLLMFGKTHAVHDYLFFETAATIITLVLLGNLIEARSVRQTTNAIRELSALQEVPARKIILESGTEKTLVISAKKVEKGNLLLVNTGDKIPVDGIVMSGEGQVDESMISGESIPVEKKTGSSVTGGTILMNGPVTMRAEKVGNDTFLAQVIAMVRSAQQKRPPIQKLGDKVSAIFVPVVLLISILTFLAGYFLSGKSLSEAIMPAIAVLVISCPCAMGLATPTAVMVGLGRAAKKGILIKGGDMMEAFSGITMIVFDKTGTLTTGQISIGNFTLYHGEEQDAKNMLFSLERFSAHPIAASMVRELEGKAKLISVNNVREEKGIGVSAIHEDGEKIQVGSSRILAGITPGRAHDLYVLKGEKLLAGLDLADTVRNSADEMIRDLKQNGIRTVMLSGDSKAKCEKVAAQLGIDEVYAEKLPGEKLALIEKLSAGNKLAMVGDGVNDAPSLARADVGISMGSGTQVAIGSAGVVLLGEGDLRKLIAARLISKHTMITIRQNLFWAFFYNVVAIPIAAAGFLSPMIGALSMAFSDVIIIGNSVRLRTKKLR